MFTKSDRKIARRKSINNREFLIAVVDEDYDEVNRLISKGVNVNYKDRDDCTALHLATANYDSNTCKLLVDNGALLDLKNNDGETPLDIAKRLKNSQIIQIFQDASNNLLQLECSHNPVHGNIYQLKILMLFLYRAVVDKYSFRLGTEIEEARKFNDLIFEYIDKDKKMYRLLQAKHKTRESRKITAESLLAEAHNDYSLIKYLISYQDSKNEKFFKNGTIKDVTIFTNIDFDYKNLQKAGIEIMKVGEEDDIFDVNIEKKESARYKFTKQLVPKLECRLKNSTLGSQCNISDAEIEDFLQHLIFAVNQPNEEELGDLIKNELRNEFDSITAENVYNKFFVYMLDWMKNKNRNVFWSYKDGKKLFDEMKKGVSIWYNVQDPVKSFTGREETLMKLHHLMQKGEKKMVCVSGLGGVGKSELVRKYIADYSQSYDNKIIWINAESYQTLVDSFRKLACEKMAVKTKNANGQEKDVATLLSEIYQSFSNGKSLFVFDNAEMYKTQSKLDAGIDKFLPNLPINSQKPHVLITSQNQKWPKVVDVQVLEGLTNQEAELFITQNLKMDQKEQKEDIVELAKKLQLLPLALQQTVAYINKQNDKLKNVGSSFKICDYFVKLTENSKEMFNFAFSKDSDNTYNKTVFTTWDITLDTIKGKENGKDALDILNISSYFLPYNIPIDILSIMKQDKEILASAIELLNQYSIINVQQNNFNLHGLVQIITRLKHKENEEDKIILKMILSKIETAHVNMKNIDHFVSLWSHSMKHVDLVKEFHEVATIICEMLMSSYKFNEARDIITKAIEILPEGNANDAKVALFSFKTNFATLLVNEGKYELALKNFLDIHEIEKRFLGLRKRKSLKTMASISLVYFKLFNSNDALKWCQKTLRMEKVIFGENHLNTLPTTTLLANILIHQKKYDEALSLLEPMCDVSKMSFSDYNNTIIKARSAIAVIYMKQSKYKEALKILSGNYNVKKLTLGENHRDTLDERIIIADVYAQQTNKYALKIYEEVLEIKSKIIGDNHLEIIKIQLSIAKLLQCFDQYDKSLLILQDVLKKQRNNLGSYHSNVLVTEWMMVVTLDIQGKNMEALQILDDLFKFKVAIVVFGNTTIEAQTSFHSLASKIFMRLEKFDSALKHALKICRIHERNLGKNHLKSLASKEQVGMIYYCKKDYKKALDILTDVNKIQEIIFGKEDTSYKSLLDTIEKIIAEFSFKTASTGCDPIQFLNRISSTTKDPFEAIRNDDLDALKKLLEEGIDPNTQSEDGRTLLHWAVNEDNFEIVTFLILNGADITRASKKGNTVLHIVALKNYIEIASALFNIASHAGLNKIINAKTKLTGKTALHVASENGFYQMMRLLLIRGAAYDIKNETNKTPLDVARDIIISELLEKIDANFQLAKSDKEKDYKYFEQHDTEDFLLFYRVRNANGYNLIQLGVMNNNKTLVHKLEKIIGDILCRSQPTFDSRSNLDELLCSATFPSVQKLISNNCKADPNAIEWLVTHFRHHDKPTLNYNILAIEDMLKLLESHENVKSMAELANFVIDSHMKLFAASICSLKLLEASMCNNVSRVMHFLSMRPNVNVEDDEGWTPLLHAVNSGNEKMIELLFLYGALTNCQIKNNKITPLHLAVIIGRLKIVDILLDRDRSKEFVNARIEVDAFSAIHIAAKKQRMDIVMLLLKKGAVYCSKNKDGKMPVDLIDDYTSKKFFEFIDDLFNDVAKGSDEVIRKIKVLKTPEFFAVLSARNDEEYTLSDFALVKNHKDLSDKIKNVIKFRRDVET